MARHRSSTKKAPEIGLFMECLEEELQPSQVSYWANADKEYNEIQNKLNYYIKQLKAEVVEKGKDCLVLQLNATPPSDTVNSFVPVSPGAVTGGRGTKQNVHNSQSYQQVVNSGIITRSTSSPANTFFVMDSGMGFMVGQLPSTDTKSESTSVHSKPISLGRNKQSVTTAAVATRGKVNSKRQTSILMDCEFPITSSTRKRDKTKNQNLSQEQVPLNSQQFNPDQIYLSDCTLSPCGKYILKVNAKELQSPSKPGESNALGGLNIGGTMPCRITGFLDDVSNNGGRVNADSKEVNFSNVTGKTFPSLVVVARPQLKAKFIPQSKVAQERSALDGRVKGVLMYSPTKFTEWLIQQGLVRSEQTCRNHLHTDLSPVKLKLGMYSDISKFPYSGGYVWISDCCPSQFVSVFSGSIFEGAPHSPTTLLKLIYHWSCQTNIQNIVQWVKVDNLYVKNFFTLMRAVCTQAVHEKYKKMGGPRKKIEVGVISLGTTSQDGNKRQVKVEVLGVMDYENKLIRLRAIESHSDERSFKRRFVRILQPLDEWVNKDSTILTDFTVNKAALNSMGFHTVFQVTSDVKYSNQNVMEYLRRIVPRMFQNTLSLLSRQLIQQFLDELVWREVWGPIPSQAFVTVIAHMSEQMKLDVNESFLIRLGQVAANPFKKWNYSVWTHAQNCDSQGSHKNHVPKANSMESAFNQGKFTRTRKRGGEQLGGEITLPPVSPSRKNAKISGKEKTKKKEKAGSEELLSDEIIKFIEEGDVLPLENYYYGWLRGEENNNGNSNGGASVSFAVKCCVCNKRFPENIVLMKHMVLHCQTEPALFTKDVHQCEHCFLGFNTSAALKRHSETVHFLTDEKINLEFLCQICEKKFTGRSELVYHMQRNHVEKELPYECGVCRFRTSVYRLFVRHFVQVHKGEDYVFCPFCLKVVEVSHKSRPITPNVFFYLSHLEKHHRPNLTKDCSHCRLSFIHKGILDQHLESDHGTWKDEPGVKCLPELFTGLHMPEPGELIKRDFPLKSLKTSKANNKNSFSAYAFKSLNVNGLDENSTCIECEEFLFNSNHFTGDFKCSKCRYGTFCEKAMLEHSTVFHEAGAQRFTIGRPTVLDSEIFCVCGFSSRSGNKTAKHLAACGRKTGYASFESALGATQSVSDRDANQGEGQSVLNFLGLIRKSSDDGSGDDNAFEKPVNDRSSLGGDSTEFNWTDASNLENRLLLVSEETHRKTNTTTGCFKRKSTIEGVTSQKSGRMSDVRPRSMEGERADSDSVASEAKERGFLDESVGGTEIPAAPRRENSSLSEREPISAERRVESEKNQGVYMKRSKPKKSKASKKTSEKTLKAENDRNSRDQSPSNNENIESNSDDSFEEKLDLKRNQMEKRKTENSEWKGFKKIECQRLETVMEEGQLSNEEARSRENSSESDHEFLETSSKPAPGIDVGERDDKTDGLVAVSEKTEFLKRDEGEAGNRDTKDKGDAVEERKREEISDSMALDAETQSNCGKRNGMMEILPIFSNDKFACSRDAISVEEYEELEPLEKRGSSTGDGNKKEVPEDRLMSSTAGGGGGTKDSFERKLRFKMLTDRTLAQKTSSQFINSLLVLTPFATDRDNLFGERKQTKLQRIGFDSLLAGPRRANSIRGDLMVEVRPVPIIICTTLGLFSVAVALAWKSYRPPCMMDYILEFIPFVRRRRTYTQLFIDRLVKIFSTIIAT